LSQLKTVLKFEYNAYIKNKVFIIITVIFASVIILGINAPNIVNLIDSVSAEASDDGYGQQVDQPNVTSFRRAAIHDPLGDYDAETLNGFMPNFRFTYYDSFDKERFEELVGDGEYVFVLSVHGLDYTVIESGGTGMFDFTVMNIPNMIKLVYQNKMYGEFGLDDEQIMRIHTANPAGTHIFVGRDLMQTFWVGYAMLILLYISVQFYGQFVATSVVTEKSSKTMELLVTSVKPVHLMFGKVLGSGLAGLTQMVVFLVSAFLMFSLTLNQWEDFSPAVAAILSLSLNLEIIVYALLFFVLAFFKFAFLFAAFASVTSRMEDVGKVIMMPLILFIASFFIAMFVGMSAPTSTFYIAASFIPFLSPMVMFMRICLTGVPVYQILIAVGINAAFIVLIGIMCAKIYRAGVLMYGKPMSLKEIAKQLIKA
jgi:ABC-2 type transport system permease protein